MSDYKQLIKTKIKDDIDKRIQKLKIRLINLSDDWRILFPNGFRPGLNIIPVITNNGASEHIVAELHFELEDDLDLDIDNVKIVNKDNVWRPEKQAELNDSLDVLNNIVVSLNGFMQSFSFKLPSGQMQLFPSLLPSAASNDVVVGDNSGSERIKAEISNSLHLPDWFKQIRDANVRNDVLRKLAEAYQQYEKSSPTPVTLKSFFDKYTDHLQSQGHLHFFCSYKGKPVQLSDDGKCIEQYCTKKPYQGHCTVPVLRFGKGA
jgi:hypothetical protein